MKNDQRRFVARGRGQVMVLGCVALLVMALMLMASFSLANSIHEKIRIQSHADAQVYSLAVIEARALNVTAHFNRAITAALVDQMSLHSWMAIATSGVGTIRAEYEALLLIAAAEVVLGCWPFNFAHCACALFATFNAGYVFVRWLMWASTLNDLCDDFDDAVKDLKEMVDALHRNQRTTLSTVLLELNTFGTALSALKDSNAPSSSSAAIFNVLNLADFACALEGTSLDHLCMGARQRNKASMSKRSEVIGAAANASRQELNVFAAQASVLLAHDNFKTFQADVPKDFLWTGTWSIHEFMTAAKIGTTGFGFFLPPDGPAERVEGAASPSSAILITSYIHIPAMPMIIGASIKSDSGGGSHSEIFSELFGGGHDEFKGVNSGSNDPCNNDESCFVNFRGEPDADKDFGMPTVMGGVTQNIRPYRVKAAGQFNTSQAPWELNTQRKVSIELIPGSPGIVDYSPRNGGTAYALAKAKTYYHQLGSWRVAPNLFDPFWRAKLHAFERTEFIAALGLVGDFDGVMISAGQAPVEGRE